MKHKEINRVLQWIVVIVVFLIMMFPFYWMVANSLKFTVDIFKVPVEIIPRRITFSAYTKQISNVAYNIGNALKNSFIISISTMILSVILSVPASYGLARFKIKGYKIFIFLFLMTQMLPQIFTLIPTSIIFSRIGVSNTYIAPILANTLIGVPFSVIMLRTYFQGIPKELDEAAKIDGCSSFKSFMLVMVPLMKTGIAVSAAFSFIFAYGDMVNSLTYNNNSKLWPVTTGIYNYVGAYGIEWNNAMAFAVFATIPIIILFVALQDYIVEGIMTGAVKG